MGTALRLVVVVFTGLAGVVVVGGWFDDRYDDGDGLLYRT